MKKKNELSFKNLLALCDLFILIFIEFDYKHKAAHITCNKPCCYISHTF